MGLETKRQYAPWEARAAEVEPDRDPGDPAQPRCRSHAASSRVVAPFERPAAQASRQTHTAGDAVEAAPCMRSCSSRDGSTDPTSLPQPALPGRRDRPPAPQIGGSWAADRRLHSRRWGGYPESSGVRAHVTECVDLARDHRHEAVPRTIVCVPGRGSVAWVVLNGSGRIGPHGRTIRLVGPRGRQRRDAFSRMRLLDPLSRARRLALTVG
jgi:hypothetical protein